MPNLHSPKLYDLEHVASIPPVSLQLMIQEQFEQMKKELNAKIVQIQDDNRQYNETLLIEIHKLRKRSKQTREPLSTLPPIISSIKSKLSRSEPALDCLPIKLIQKNNEVPYPDKSRSLPRRSFPRFSQKSQSRSSSKENLIS